MWRAFKLLSPKDFPSEVELWGDLLYMILYGLIAGLSLAVKPLALILGLPPEDLVFLAPCSNGRAISCFARNRQKPRVDLHQLVF